MGHSVGTGCLLLSLGKYLEAWRLLKKEGFSEFQGLDLCFVF